MTLSSFNNENALRNIIERGFSRQARRQLRGGSAYNRSVAMSIGFYVCPFLLLDNLQSDILRPCSAVSASAPFYLWQSTAWL